MRKLTGIILLSVLINSCGVTNRNLPHLEYSFDIDFSKYAKNNFLITTDIYRGKYISYGIMEYTIFPSEKMIVYRGRMSSFKYDKEKYYIKGQWLIEKLKIENVIDKIYNKAIKLGADAMIDLKIKEVSRISNNLNADHTYAPGIKVRALAIKRLD